MCIFHGALRLEAQFYRTELNTSYIVNCYKGSDFVFIIKKYNMINLKGTIFLRILTFFGYSS